MSNETRMPSQSNGFNQGTRICALRPELLESWMMHGIRDLFGRSFEAIRSAYGETKEFSYLLFAVNRNNRHYQSKVVGLEPGVFQDLVIGRHTRCHLSLQGDGAVSLRHVLVRFFLRPEDLVPIVKVLDLATPTGFRTVDGQETTGLVGAGHCMFSLGEYYLFLIYNNDDALPTDAEEAWQALQPAQPPQLKENVFRSFDDLVSPAQVKARLKRVTDSPDYDAKHTFSGNTAVFRIRGPEVVEDRSPGPSETFVTLLLKAEEAGLDLRIALLPSQLQRGLLIGRYDRCELGGGRIELPEGVSRVHLILIEDEGVCWAIDAASSNGSAVFSVPFATRKLTGITRIRLATELELTWLPVFEGEEKD